MTQALSPVELVSVQLAALEQIVRPVLAVEFSVNDPEHASDVISALLQEFPSIAADVHIRVKGNAPDLGHFVRRRIRELGLIRPFLLAPVVPPKAAFEIFRFGIGKVARLPVGSNLETIWRENCDVHGTMNVRRRNVERLKMELWTAGYIGANGEPVRGVPVS